MPPSNPLPTSQVAAQYIPPKPLQLRINQTAPVPTLPNSGVATLVRVVYASINPVDYKLGSLPGPVSRLIVGPSPITPGGDFYGRVYATTHPDLKPGDRVWGTTGGPTPNGTCAQYTVVKGTNNISKIPENWTGNPEDLGVVGIAGFTALQAFLSADIPYVKSKGQSTGGKVFINGGSGGVGTYAIQIAKHGMSCDTVVASCSGANVDLVKSLGADEVIDYRTTNVSDGLKAWSQRNGGAKFDAIVDNVTSDFSIYWEAEKYLKPASEGGRYINIGGGLDPKMIYNVLKVMMWPTLLGGSTIPYQLLVLKAVEKHHFDLLGGWMAEGKVKTLIEDENRFELADLGKAFEKLKGGRTRGKISIKIAEEGQ